MNKMSDVWFVGHEGSIDLADIVFLVYNCTYMVGAIIPDYIIVYRISGIFLSCESLCFLSSLGYCVALMGRMGREWQFRRKINKGGEMGMIWLSAHNLLH